MEPMGNRWRALLVLFVSVSLFSLVNPARSEELDYLMQLDLFPAEHGLEGSLKAKVADEVVRGFMHPDLVIDSITNEKGREVRYEKVDGDLVVYPEGSVEIIIRFHGEPYDEIRKREMVGQYTDIFTGNILRLFTKSQRPMFSISVPRSFTVLKLMEPVTEVRVEDGESMNCTKPIGGEDPSVEIRGDRAVYIFKTTVSSIWFISAEYVSSRATEDGIDFRVYLFPEHEGMLNETMDLTQRIIEFYSEKYYPYPLKEFRVVETPWEYNTNRANDRYSTSLISFGMGELVESLGVELNESVKNYINVLYTAVHETSHFWFGGLVASEALNEGSAVFSELLFTESFDPELSIELRKYYTHAMLNDSDWQSVSFADAEWSPRTQWIRYCKGGMIAYMLYHLMGEDVFDVFHEYFERYGGVPGVYNKASLEDFTALVNEKKDMSWFFDEWVYRPGLPDYGLSNLSVNRKRGGYELEFDIVQKGDVYTMPIEISAGSSTEEFWVDERAERVKMSVEEFPDRIVLDPDYRIPKQSEVSLTLSRMDRLKAICDLY